MRLFVCVHVCTTASLLLCLCVLCPCSISNCLVVAVACALVCRLACLLLRSFACLLGGCLLVYVLCVSLFVGLLNGSEVGVAFSPSCGCMFVGVC